MVHLKNEPMINRGQRRLVFAHPEHPDRCLKVLDPANQPADIRGGKSWALRLRPLRSFDNNLVERREYDRLNRRNGNIPECFPQFHGMEQTDLGPALVQELLRDSNGAVSSNLKSLVKRDGSNDDFLATLRPAMQQYVNNLLSCGAIVHHLNLVNTVVQERNGTFRAALVDGIGAYSVFPVLHWFPGAVRIRMRSKLRRFIRALPPPMKPELPA